MLKLVCSFAFLGIFLIVVKLVGTVQGFYGNEGDSCFINITQQEGICRQKLECDEPCSDGETVFELCGTQPRGEMPIVCCPKPRPIPTSISAKKCFEYKELACDLHHLFEDPIDLKVSNCAANNQPVIVGGEEALRREFPHMALLGWADGDDKLFGCGGTLISDQFVLSAAHCFEHRKYGPLVYVRLGEHDKSATHDATHIDLNVAELIKHPHYRSAYDYNDIGLIRLDSVVKFSYAIRPACLPEEPISSDIRNAIATGWRSTHEHKTSNVLTKVGLELYDDIRCSNEKLNYRSPMGIQKETQFCAGSDDLVNSICGDSGGPVQIIHKHHYCTYTIIGVTVRSSGGCSNRHIDRPLGVYTRVYSYLSWIESQVWPNETDFK